VAAASDAEIKKKIGADQPIPGTSMMLPKIKPYWTK
jgi:hypothetical protein